MLSQENEWILKNFKCAFSFSSNNDFLVNIQHQMLKGISIKFSFASVKVLSQHHSLSFENQRTIFYSGNVRAYV